jgi:hypothetical protein
LVNEVLDLAVIHTSYTEMRGFLPHGLRLVERC